MKRFVDYLTRELNLDKSQREIIHYGLYSLLYTGLSVAVSLIAAFILGILPETAAVLAVMMLYRKTSGGAHVASPQGCLITGTLVVLVLAKLSTIFAPLYGQMAVVLFLPPILALIIAFYRVPADVPQKPITSSKQIRTLRLLSFLFLFVWIGCGAIVSITNLLPEYFFAGNLGLLWQSFLLTPPGYQVLALLDPLFKKKKPGRNM